MVESTKDIPDLIEISSPYELTNGAPVFFKAKRESLTHFYFKVDAKMVINIKAWALKENSYPDLYVNVN